MTKLIKLSKEQWLSKFGGLSHLSEPENWEVVPCVDCDDNICHGWKVERLQLISSEEFLENNAYSASLFLEHFKFVLKFTSDFQINMTLYRTYAKLSCGNRTIKAYCHHNGRSREWLTFTKEDGTEIESFHHNTKPSLVMAAIMEFLFWPAEGE